MKSEKLLTPHQADPAIEDKNDSAYIAGMNSQFFVAAGVMDSCE